MSEENPQDSEKIVKKDLFDENGKFKVGHPKVGGKMAGSKSFTTKVREALEKIAEGRDYTYEEAFIKSILKKAIVDGDASTQRLIWNYLDGMPAQKMDLTSKGESIIPIYGGQSLQANNSDEKDISTEEEDKGS